MRPPAQLAAAGPTRRYASALRAGHIDGRLAILSAGALAALLIAVLLAASATPASAADCPNEIRRQEQGVTALRLPNCRAYEMVSPGTFPQQWLDGGSRGARTSLDGNSYAYFEFYPGVGFDNSSLFYLSRRGVDGWRPETSTPQQTPGAKYMYQCDPQVFYSRDFSRNILQSGYHTWFKDEGPCKTNEAVLDPRENREWANLFTHDNATGGYELASVYPEGATPSNSEFQASSPDMKTVVFAALSTDLSPDAPRGLNYYVASGGQVQLLGYLPDGSPYVGTVERSIGNPSELTGGETPVLLNASLIGSRPYWLSGGGSHLSQVPGSGDDGGAYLRRAVSSDGSKVFFYAGGNLYVRLNPAQPQSAVLGGVCTEPAKACTVQVDRSQGPGSSGGGRMSFASEDGSKVFFTSAKKMTADSTAEAGKEDLYEYDVETEALTDLTVNPGEPAGVQNVTWVSPDGDYVFFVAQAALAAGALPGNCRENHGSEFCNLYVEHGGQVRLIASLSNEDAPTWGYATQGGSTVQRTGYGIGGMVSSPNGRYFAFESTANLTPYDAEGSSELYLYDYGTEGIQCASCLPGGSGGIGTSFFSVKNGDGAQAYGPVTHLTDNGRLFFETQDPLAAPDTNGRIDVYMYENGSPHLISGGQGDNNAHFQDASPDGSNAFFVTAEPLLRTDTDGASTIYDARIGGGFPEPPALPGCEGEACRGAGTAANGSVSTGSASFQGPGNQHVVHRRPCGETAKRARRLSRSAKQLRRKAKRSSSSSQARRLTKRSAKLAKKGRAASKNAKRCRRANRRAGK